VTCPEGEAAASGASCQRCPTGEYAPKEFVLEVFHVPPEGFVTGCAWGDCTSYVQEEVGGKMEEGTWRG
jgi:hypothetical protein